ncbi:MAG: translation initiation factor IF-2 [Clostridia bacterium]|nr:translation initiation factor IF-2 [Clostridia bacterium]
MAANKNQTRVSNLAKDLGMKNKEIIDVLAARGIEGKTHSTVLTSDEFGLVMSAITETKQIESLDDYLDGKIKIEAPKAEAPKPQQPAKSKAPKAEAPKAEAPKPEAPKPEAPKAEAPKAEAPKPEAPKPEAPKTEAPKTEAPKTEAPKAEAPKAEAPKAEAPKTEAPKQDARPQNRNDRPNNDRRERRDSQRGERSDRPDRPQNNDRRERNDRSDRPDRQQNGERRDFQRSDRPQGDRPERSDRPDRPQGERRDFQRGDRPQGDRPQTGERRDFQRGERSDRPQNNWNNNRPQNSGGGAFRDKDKDSGSEKRQSGPKPAPVHTYTRGQNGPKNPGESRVVDTRTTTVDLEKYDERLESFVPESSKDVRGEKQKLKKQNTRDNQGQREKERMAMEKLRKQGIERAKKQPLQITVPDEITVGELASRLKMTAGEVIKKLMGLGVMATLNEVIDYDTAYLVADELGAKVTKEVVVTIEEKLFDDSEDAAEDLVPRDPVVCVMGHVDHGKTSLLDAIRHTNVTSGEAGGITQAIGAYRVRLGDRDITFLDTPGHEAFTAMRARGAKSTDIAILVVAADDGIMPQTIEAINHAKAAGIDIVVAINKMDKPTANPDNVKQELTKYSLVPEEWGGDVICVPVSALTKMGIDELLENVLLVADMKEMKANPSRRAKGLILEAKLDKGRGPVATVLVQNGTLKTGDIVIAGTAVGRVRAMTDDKGRTVKTAGPSVPVEIIGLAEVPESGDEFAAVEDERMARELAEQRREKAKDEQFKQNAQVNLNDLFAQISEGVKDLNIIVKADVGGSAEAVKQSLVKLSNEEVRVNIIHTAVGGITEGDVMLASASNALIVGFNVRPDKSAIDKAEKETVEIRTYRIIYECIEEIEAAMKGMLAPTFKEVLLGHAEVRQTIHVPNVGTIAGSYVQDGKVSRNAQIRVVRDGVVILEDKISSLKRFKDDAKEVAQGFECGIGLERFNDIKEGDVLEAFVMEEVKPV